MMGEEEDFVDKRLSIDNYLWSLAFEVAKRSTCDRFFAGCVIARDGKILSTGYNGSPDGEPHCDEAGHELVMVEPTGLISSGDKVKEKLAYLPVHCVRTIHAEINAIINAAYSGMSIAYADWYINGWSCQNCSKAIARLYPNRVFFCMDNGPLPSKESVDWWKSRTILTYASKQQLAELGVIKC